jgi:hypothetical protein
MSFFINSFFDFILWDFDFVQYYNHLLIREDLFHHRFFLFYNFTQVFWEDSTPFFFGTTQLFFLSLQFYPFEFF